jgi:hypothetical protein
MRLLKYNKDDEFSLAEFSGDNIPQYAILSHRWGEGEVTLADLMDGTGKSKAGYGKIRFCGEQARVDRLQYFWVDTCCIDKSNSVELAEAINSMFRWYQDAAKCYVYLPDVSRKPLDTDKFNEPWEAKFGGAHGLLEDGPCRSLLRRLLFNSSRKRGSYWVTRHP